MIRLILTFLILTTSLTTTGAQAQDRRPSHCIAIADAAPGIRYLHRASWSDALPEYTVRLHYIDHAAFLIRTRGGLNVITDFTGFIGTTKMIPDVVTMNHAHGSHFTPAPDPAIPHALKGWGPGYGEGIDHYLDLGEMVIRNVSTDIRSGGGVEPKGNSIFVFEVEGLCIGHLGHLHHEPDDAQYSALGRLDVVMAPVDGGLTLPLPVMIKTLKRLKSSVVIPMHWFSDFALARFAEGMADDFDIVAPRSSSIEISLATLPSRPTVVMLRPSWLVDEE